VEKIKKDLDGLINLVEGLMVGIERAPGGKAAEAEKTQEKGFIGAGRITLLTQGARRNMRDMYAAGARAQTR
jgi:hypothetical protein